MKREGFTLIELMVVIAIIGLLAAVALPRFAGVSDSAKVANVQGNLSTVRTSIAMYHARNDMYPALMEKENELEDVKNSSIASDKGIAFTEFYGKSKMANTPADKRAGVDVADINSISEPSARAQNKLIGDGRGGWVYDGPISSEGPSTGPLGLKADGSIRANLIEGTYGDRSIDWHEF